MAKKNKSYIFVILILAVAFIFALKFRGLFNLVSTGADLTIPLDDTYKVTIKGQRDFYFVKCDDTISYIEPVNVKVVGYDSFGCKIWEYQKKYGYCDTGARCGDYCFSGPYGVSRIGDACDGKSSTYDTYCSKYCTVSNVEIGSEVFTATERRFHSMLGPAGIYDIYKNGERVAHFGESNFHPEIAEYSKYDYSRRTNWDYNNGEIVIQITDTGIDNNEEYIMGKIHYGIKHIEFCYGKATQCSNFVGSAVGKPYKVYCDVDCDPLKGFAINEDTCECVNVCPNGIYYDGNCYESSLPKICTDLNLTTQESCANFLDNFIIVANATLEEKAQFVKELSLTIEEQAILIEQLTQKRDEQAEIIKQLKLDVEEQAQLINNLTQKIDEQAELINQLATNLEYKAELIKQLTVENEKQAQLIKEMEQSFAKQGEIIKAMNLTIEDDARIISELTSNVNEQAQIIEAMELKLEDMSELIVHLRNTVKEKEEIIKQLELSLEEEKQLEEQIQQLLEKEKLKTQTQRDIIYVLLVIVILLLIVLVGSKVKKWLK